MQKLTRLAVLMSLAMSLTISIAAQKNESTYRQQGDYTIGFNGGVAYQQSDVANDLNGLGFGFTYGKNLIYSPHAPFSVDVRSRFQIARSFGTDFRPTLGISRNDALNGENTLDYTGENEGGLVYANHKTNQAEVGMEGVLTLNGLREKTGVGLSFTGGVWLNWYKTMIDQRDENGLYADQYSRIDAGGAKPYNLSQLNGFRDGEYETLADGFSRLGKFGIMPSLGIEVDYDLTDNLALGVGHRMTFSGTDLLDGQQWTDANALTGNNDILHYTSLGLKYTIPQSGGKRKNNRQPSIELIDPHSSGLSTDQAYVPIKAIIHRVENPFDVYLTVNGKEQRFNYSNNTLAGQIRLAPGENKIVISANNQAGNAKKTIFLTYETEASLGAGLGAFGMPEINFTNPATDNLKVEQREMSLRAKVRLVDNEKQIELRVNGKKKRFDFDEGIAVLESTIDLREGNNTIEIRAKNKNGEQQVTRSIFRALPVPFPTVQFTSPAYNNAEVENSLATIKIKLTDISQSTDIQLLVNGRNEPNFYFDYSTGLVKADIQLREGSNQIEVIAINKRGEARDQKTIIYRRPYTPVVRSPRVRINAPQYRESTTREERVTIQATVENIFRSTDIRLTNNGQAIYDFDFNPNTGVLRHNLYLRPGINQIAIEAINEAGRDGASATINFESYLPPPPTPVILVPTVDIFQPRRNATFEEREITVKANLSGIASKRDIEVILNRNNFVDFRFNPTNGSFRAKVLLKEGRNELIIKAVNPAGVDRQKVIVYHERPYAPVIEVRQSDYTATQKERIKIKAKIEHIENKRDIQVLLNTRTIRDVQSRDNKVEAEMRLKEGVNDIEIIAENKYGNDRKQWTIEYTLPQPPSIVMRNISDQQTFREDRLKLEATIKNIANKRSIKLFVNGVGARSFNWEADKFTAPIRLKEGRNSIVLKASNDYGREEINLQVNYLKPRIPNIDFVSHDNNVAVSEKHITLKASLKNVDNKEDIQLSVNGKKTAFTFRNGRLSSPLSLSNGKNKIRLTATTDESTIEKALTIQYKPAIKKPAIRFITANKMKKNTQHMTSKVVAEVENVNSRGKIKLEVNGKNVNDFDFTNGQVSATIPLKMGLNTIRLSAENESGLAESETTITRRTGRPAISKGGSLGKVSVVKKNG